MDPAAGAVAQALPDRSEESILDESVYERRFRFLNKTNPYHFFFADGIEDFPEGTKVIEVISWGSSAWTKTAKINTVSPSGEKEYFLKCASYRGLVMMRGEWQSLNALYELDHKICPKAYGWGKFKSSETYFLLMDFLPMKETLPNPAKFCRKIAYIHQKSKSPTGYVASLTHRRLYSQPHQLCPDSLVLQSRIPMARTYSPIHGMRAGGSYSPDSSRSSTKLILK